MLLLAFISCKKVKDLREDVKPGMHYNEVVAKVGKPDDSTAYTNADGNFIHNTRYIGVENFSGYAFRVNYNDSLKVIDAGYD